MGYTTNYKKVSGTGEAADGSVDAEIIAAETGKTIHIQKAIVCVHVASAGNAGKAALEDGAGGTRFFECDADTVGVHRIDFGDFGYPLTSATALNLTVDEDGGTEATATCTAVGYVL